MWDITPAPPPGDRFIKTDADTQVPLPLCVCVGVKPCGSVSYTGDNVMTKKLPIKALLFQHVPKST